MQYSIEEIQTEDRKRILELMDEYWGGDPIIVHGEIFHTSALKGFKAVQADEIAGFLHYQIRGEECEILTLLSLQEEQGIGSSLIGAAESAARKRGCKKLSLITTNDNLHALGFYQRQGFHLAALYPGQVNFSRKLKPSISEIGDNNIPLRDELQLEKRLT